MPGTLFIGALDEVHDNGGGGASTMKGAYLNPEWGDPKDGKQHDIFPDPSPNRAVARRKAFEAQAAAEVDAANAAKAAARNASSPQSTFQASYNKAHFASRDPDTGKPGVGHLMPVSFWAEQSGKGITGATRNLASTDSPFAKNSTFSTPIADNQNMPADELIASGRL